MYADYNFYVNTFGGSTVPEQHWQYAAGRASEYLDAATFGRLAEGIPAEYASHVQSCCCELAEQLDSFRQQSGAAGNSGGSAIASEKIGSYSVTYRSPSEAAASLLHGDTAGLADVLASIVRKHLGRTGRLYRGV